MNDALDHVTPSNWASAIAHVEKVEDAFRKVDFQDNEPIVEKMVIQVGGEDDSESEFEDSGDDDVSFLSF